MEASGLLRCRPRRRVRFAEPATRHEGATAEPGGGPHRISPAFRAEGSAGRGPCASGGAQGGGGP